MPFLLQPFHVMLLVLSEFVRKEQEKRIEFLLLESQIFRETIGGNRVLLTDDQRRRLAIKGRVLGRRQLEQLSVVSQADTILRWHRELIEKPEQRSSSRHATGRPRIDQEVVDLVLRMARENESWGYKRIQGQLSNVGFRIGKTSVANILKAHGIEPAPVRRQTPSWATFFNSHWDVLQESGLDAITLWFSKLIGCFSKPVSNDSAVVGDTALENSVATCSLATLTVPILHVAESTTQSSRGPPAGVQLAIFHPDSRNAAQSLCMGYIRANRILTTFGTASGRQSRLENPLVTLSSDEIPQKAEPRSRSIAGIAVEISSWIAGHPRPSNHTKIYGSGYKNFGTGGPEDGVERFWRNILGGSASARFHRPDSGNGLNDFAKGSIKAARHLESQIKFWEIRPQMSLLSDRESNEAYLAAKPGEYYALYFTNGGSVGLDLSDATGSFDVTWISVSMGVPTRTSAAGGSRLMKKTIGGGGVVTMSAPYKGGWAAAVVKK